MLTNAMVLYLFQLIKKKNNNMHFRHYKLFSAVVIHWIMSPNLRVIDVNMQPLRFSQEMSFSLMNLNPTLSQQSCYILTLPVEFLSYYVAILYDWQSNDRWMYNCLLALLTSLHNSMTCTGTAQSLFHNMFLNWFWDNGKRNSPSLASVLVETHEVCYWPYPTAACFSHSVVSR